MKSCCHLAGDLGGLLLMGRPQIPKEGNLSVTGNTDFKETDTSDYRWSTEGVVGPRVVKQGGLPGIVRRPLGLPRRVNGLREVQ